MTVLFVMTLLGWQGGTPGLIDSFRSNFSAIRAEGSYEYRSGRLPTNLFKVDVAPLKDAISFVDKEPRVVRGDWSSYDGVERFLQGPPQPSTAPDHPGAARTDAGGGSGYSRGPQPLLEVLFDGITMAKVKLSDSNELLPATTVEVLNEPMGGLVLPVKGPFVWWEYSLIAMLKVRFSGVTPQSSRLVMGDAALEVETYTKTQPVGWVKLEIAYDPQIGFLPRRTRYLSFDGKKTYVREWRLVDYRLTARGAAVPSEWFSGLFEFDDFSGEYPSYDASTKLSHADGFVGGGHFRLTSFRNCDEPVGLMQLKGRVTLIAMGGEKRLGSAPTKLTLADVRRDLGKYLTQPAPVPPEISVDLEERDRFRQPRVGVAYHLYGLLLASALSVFVLFRRTRGRATSLSMLASLLMSQAGCRDGNVLEARLVCSFKQPVFLYEGGKGPLAMELELTNEGRSAVRILKADGGCSCRKVDQRSLPCDLPPAGRLVLPVSYEPSRGSRPQYASFTMQTDKGSVPVSAMLYPLPKHHLDPESPSHHLIDDEDWTFEIRSQSIYESGGQPPITTLSVPKAFDVLELRRERGVIDGAPAFSFEAVVSQIKLIDRSLGAFKEVFRCLDDKGETLSDSSVVWTRAPYLSTFPERAVAGVHPSRVFLRCPDDSVELIKVTSCPEELSVVIGSPRELIIKLKREPEHSLDVRVLIETTATERPPLDLRVVYYKSQASGD